MKLKSIKPLFTNLVVTANQYEEDDKTKSGIVTLGHSKGDYKEFQTVLKVGSAVRDIKEGDTVLLNFNNFRVKDKRRPENDENSLRADFVEPTYTIDLPVFKTTEGDVMFIDMRDIIFGAEVVEDEDEAPAKKPKLILPKAKTLKGAKPTIIV